MLSGAVMVLVGAALGFGVAWWLRRPQRDLAPVEALIRHVSVAQKTAALSHDVRNGLVGVLGNAQLGAQLGSLDDLKASLVAIEEASLQLSNELRDANERLRLPEAVITQQPLAPLVQAALAVRRRHVEQVRVEVSLGDSQAAVDGLRLSAALAFVLENAAATGSPIVIRAVDNAEGTTLTVADRGVGFPEAVLVRPFRAVAPERGHLGVGLASVNALVEPFAEVKLGNADGGAFVTFRFPKAKP